MSANPSKSNANGTLNVSSSDVRDIRKNARKRRILARISQVTIFLGIFAASFAIGYYKAGSGYPYALAQAPLISLARTKTRWVPAMWMNIVALVVGFGAGIMVPNNYYPEGSYYGVVSRDNLRSKTREMP